MKTQTTTTVNGIGPEFIRDSAEAIAGNPALGMAGFAVKTHWTGGFKTTTRVDEWSIGGQVKPRGFVVHTDEPPELAGTSLAPNPQEVLFAGLNACMTVGYIAQCALRGIEVRSLTIETDGELDLRGFLMLDPGVMPGYDEIRYTVTIDADATEQQLQEVHEAVKASSPNYFNLARAIPMRSRLVVKE